MAQTKYECKGFVHPALNGLSNEIVIENQEGPLLSERTRCEGRLKLNNFSMKVFFDMSYFPRLQGLPHQIDFKTFNKNVQKEA
jgi:hypothetical protein